MVERLVAETLVNPELSLSQYESGMQNLEILDSFYVIEFDMEPISRLIVSLVIRFRLERRLFV